MPIQILPARLANQIAAGEVVERPASVVKELVENSLDAGATQIDVEIEKGGHKRILIRDNGCGIGKSELGLALSRHATSKIACLDDLEQIGSLGFRGEALASVSSVARLNLTSRPADQSEAWQAHTEGRDMEVQLNPAAHPTGTSVEVLDLFFNTPARRKFLRTEKTEFQHIDEVLRRIALSRFDVAFSLKHNGKLVRKSPVVREQSTAIKRVSAICGSAFADGAIEVTSSYQGMKLRGWIAGSGGERAQNDLQYFYVNHRMMRDKLINHAIRQAFEGLIRPESYPAFVLYLEVDAKEVDVNVHPAKHEVRFHQARLVHDFIYRAITDSLEQAYHGDGQSKVSEALPDVVPQHDYIAPLQVESEPVHSQRSFSSSGSTGSSQPRGQQVSSAAARNYQSLMTPDSTASPLPPSASGVLVDGKYWLENADENLCVLPLSQVLKDKLVSEFGQSVPVAQPLLMPVSLQADDDLIASAQGLHEALLASSVEIGWAGKRVLLRKVPAGMRQYPWTQMLPQLLSCDEQDVNGVRAHLFDVIARFSMPLTQPDAMQLVCWWRNQPESARRASPGLTQALGQWLDSQHE